MRNQRLSLAQKPDSRGNFRLELFHSHVALAVARVSRFRPQHGTYTLLSSLDRVLNSASAMASEYLKLLQKYNSLQTQYRLHLGKFSAAGDRDDFYAAKDALNDMVDFHNESCKVNDQALRRTGRPIDNNNSLAGSAEFLRSFLADYELSHRTIRS